MSEAIINNLRKIVARNGDQNYAIYVSTSDMRSVLYRISLMREALTAARYTIASDRDTLVECHGGQDELEPIAQDGVADYDRVLMLIDAAMRGE